MIIPPIFLILHFCINCGHQGTATNMQGTKSAFECAFEICDHTDSTEQQYIDVCQWCSVSANHSPLSYQSPLLTLCVWYVQLATDTRGCSLWRSLLERPPPAPESRVRDPLGELVRTRVGGVTLILQLPKS